MEVYEVCPGVLLGVDGKYYTRSLNGRIRCVVDGSMWVVHERDLTGRPVKIKKII